MKAVIFDLDGTVLDTLADIGAACNTVLAELGFPQHPIPAYQKMVGNGFETLAKRALPQNLMPDACALMEITGRMRKQYAANMMTHTRPYPGITETLTELESAGIALAILSNKPDPLTRELINHYFPKIKFTVIQGAMPDVPLKPDPQAVIKIIADCQSDSACAFYVGDSNVDMETAANAGIRSIGVGWGFRGLEELKAAHAWRTIAAPSELVPLILS